MAKEFDNKTVFDVKEIAEMEGKSTKTIYRHLKSLNGKLNGFIYGKYRAYRGTDNGQWSFERSEKVA